MADIYEFKPPTFLTGHSADEVMMRMVGRMPDKYDTSEGGFIRDLFTAMSMEKSELVEFQFTEVLRNLFPMFAYDDMLDNHGASRGMVRKAAVAAKGSIRVFGEAGAVIDAGSIVTTTAERSDDETVEFETDVEATIDESGVVDIAVTAIETGLAGNIAAGAINRFEDAPAGVTKVTNLTATTGGVDEESEESYRARIVEYDQAQGESFVGSVADYRRWALSVVGVGNARVIPAQDNSGLVTIVIVDSEGQSASAELCQRVHDSIMRPDDELLRKAPPNVPLLVISPSPMNISITATVITDDTISLETVKERFIDALRAYYAGVDDGVIRYSRIGQLLVGIKGVVDYDALTVNGASANITISREEIATTTESMVTFT